MRSIWVSVGGGVEIQSDRKICRSKYESLQCWTVTDCSEFAIVSYRF